MDALLRKFVEFIVEMRQRNTWNDEK